MTQNAINNTASTFDVGNINLVTNTISTTDTDGDLILSPDGTGTVDIAYATPNAVTVYGASGALSEVGPLIDGQLVIGNTGSAPAAAALTAGAGIIITNASGTITIAAPGGGLTWNEVTGTSAQMEEDSGFVANNAGLVTLTLPDTAAFGTEIKVDGKGAGGWLIAQNADEIISFLGQTTTSGPSGSLASTGQFDCVTIRCISANLEWVVESATGNLTVT